MDVLKRLPLLLLFLTRLNPVSSTCGSETVVYPETSVSSGYLRLTPTWEGMGGREFSLFGWVKAESVGPEKIPVFSVRLPLDSPGGAQPGLEFWLSAFFVAEGAAGTPPQGGPAVFLGEYSPNPGGRAETSARFSLTAGEWVFVAMAIDLGKNSGSLQVTRMGQGDYSRTSAALNVAFGSATLSAGGRIDLSCPQPELTDAAAAVAAAASCGTLRVRDFSYAERAFLDSDLLFLLSTGQRVDSDIRFLFAWGGDSQGFVSRDGSMRRLSVIGNPLMAGRRGYAAFGGSSRAQLSFSLPEGPLTAVTFFLVLELQDPLPEDFTLLTWAGEGNAPRVIVSLPRRGTRRGVAIRLGGPVARDFNPPAADFLTPGRPIKLALAFFEVAGTFRAMVQNADGGSSYLSPSFAFALPRIGSVSLFSGNEAWGGSIEVIQFSISLNAAGVALNSLPPNNSNTCGPCNLSLNYVRGGPRRCLDCPESLVLDVSEATCAATCPPAAPVAAVGRCLVTGVIGSGTVPLVNNSTGGPVVFFNPPLAPASDIPGGSVVLFNPPLAPAPNLPLNGPLLGIPADSVSPTTLWSGLTNGTFTDPVNPDSSTTLDANINFYRFGQATFAFWIIGLAAGIIGFFFRCPRGYKDIFFYQKFVQTFLVFQYFSFWLLYSTWLPGNLRWFLRGTFSRSTLWHRVFFESTVNDHSGTNDFLYHFVWRPLPVYRSWVLEGVVSHFLVSFGFILLVQAAVLLLTLLATCLGACRARGENRAGPARATAVFSPGSLMTAWTRREWLARQFFYKIPITTFLIFTVESLAFSFFNLFRPSFAYAFLTVSFIFAIIWFAGLTLLTLFIIWVGCRPAWSKFTPVFEDNFGFVWRGLDPRRPAATAFAGIQYLFYWLFAVVLVAGAGSGVAQAVVNFILLSLFVLYILAVRPPLLVFDMVEQILFHLWLWVAKLLFCILVWDAAGTSAGPEVRRRLGDAVIAFLFIATIWNTAVLIYKLVKMIWECSRLMAAGPPVVSYTGLPGDLVGVLGVQQTETVVSSNFPIYPTSQSVGFPTSLSQGFGYPTAQSLAYPPDKSFGLPGSGGFPPQTFLPAAPAFASMTPDLPLSAPYPRQTVEFREQRGTFQTPAAVGAFAGQVDSTQVWPANTLDAEASPSEFRRFSPPKTRQFNFAADNEPNDPDGLSEPPLASDSMYTTPQVQNAPNPQMDFNARLGSLAKIRELWEKEKR